LFHQDFRKSKKNPPNFFGKCSKILIEHVLSSAKKTLNTQDRPPETVVAAVKNSMSFRDNLSNMLRWVGRYISTPHTAGVNSLTTYPSGMSNVT